MVEEFRNPSEGGADGAQPDAQRRLDVLQQAARTFAHDFKNPLSALLLGLQRLARLADPDREPKARSLATRLESTIQSMNRLVEGLSDLARHQGRALRLETSRQPAAEVIARAVEGLRAGAGERRQQLLLDVASDLPEVEWDTERVLRALLHLLTTALQAAPEGGSVRCSASAADGKVTVVIEGDGLQAPRPSDPSLFDPDRPRPSRRRELAVLFAEALAEAHAGSLSCEALECGTRFLLTLPVSPRAATDAP
jgi:signal transduction histidine kinase